MAAATEPSRVLETGSSEASDLVDSLGADLLALIQAQGVPVARLATITALPSPVRTRAAFEIQLADGTRLKGRRLRSAQRADAVAHLREVVGAGFAPILARRGEAMLLAWVEGRSLASLDPVPAPILQRCGEMLGALHRKPFAPLPGGTPTRPDEHFAKLVRNTDLLLAARVLDPELARRALRAADANRPESVTLGIIHKDFCAENLVLDPEDSLICIDDASLSTGPHDLDLARTWYRWPMRPGDLAHFESGYEQLRSLADFRRHFRFWTTCVLMGSAATRLRSLAPGALVPIERLQQLCSRD
jgi:hypothetical protein